MNCPICSGDCGWLKDFEGTEYFQCEDCNWHDKGHRIDKEEK